MFCEKCGSQAKETDKFCANCGDSFAGAEKAAQTEVLSADQKRRYKTRIWISLLSPVAVFVGIVLLLGVVNLIVGTTGSEVGETPNVQFINAVLIPLLFSLCILASPIGIVLAIYYGLKSKEKYVLYKLRYSNQR